MNEITVHTKAKARMIFTVRESVPFFVDAMFSLCSVGFSVFMVFESYLLKGTLLPLLPKLREGFFYTGSIGKTQVRNPGF